MLWRSAEKCKVEKKNTDKWRAWNRDVHRNDIIRSTISVPALGHDEEGAPMSSVNGSSVPPSSPWVQWVDACRENPVDPPHDW